MSTAKSEKIEENSTRYATKTYSEASLDKGAKRHCTKATKCGLKICHIDELIFKK